MKLALVHPCIGRIPGEKYLRAWQMEPLPMAHLAGLTPNGIEIEFFDDRMEEINFDCGADLVAISVETYTAKRAYQIASMFRERGATIVMGGFHATLMPDEVAEFAEAVVVGEAEGIWPKLLEDFRNNALKPRYSQPKRPDISRVMPDRSVFKGKRYLPIALVEAGRGCTFNCDFCVIQSYFNSTQNHRHFDTIIEEVRELAPRTKLFFFVDDNVVSRPERAKAFFERLIPLKIKWVSQATITMTYDRELLGLMHRSGCQGVLIGLESLNPANLKAMNKSFNATRGGANEAVRRLHEFGIRLYGTFIFGYDHDSPDVFRETLRYCLDNSIFMAAFNHLTPFPGTPLYERLRSEKRLLFDRWWLDENYRYGDVPFRTVMPAEEIRAGCQQARRDFYSYRSILRRSLHRTNRGKSLSDFWMYVFINGLLHRDTELRYRYPLGDPRFSGRYHRTARTKGGSLNDEVRAYDSLVGNHA